MAPPKSDFEREMMLLEGEIKRLEAEYTMFFAGRLPRPPWETRKRVDALVKKHDRAYIQNTADRFRFNTMQSRYAKFCELWERQLNAQEYGKFRRGATIGSTFVEAEAGTPAAAAATSGSPGSTEPKRQPPERVVHVANFRDPAAESERVKELYERLAEARKETGEAPLAFDRVAALVKAQVEKHRGDGSEVAFRVAMKDGKVSLTVKPVKDGE